MTALILKTANVERTWLLCLNGHDTNTDDDEYSKCQKTSSPSLSLEDEEDGPVDSPAEP